ncbi:DUF4123 domain-containing protein [Azospirillum brasilense]|uniref:DUF4123 domain-containing protein n=1 Tax=Azospirillum brasilense TaxID=192 RepID=UPI000E0C1DE0|nr:DUF4123 domain-containing protein [Azospirillum brasilense]
MIAEPALRTLAGTLFTDRVPVYAVIDGAGCPALLPMLDRHGVPSICLYRGELEPELAEAAPYLAELVPDSPFTRWFLGEGWDRHWGILLKTEAGLAEMRSHLRHLTMARLPDGRVVYFRFYDPRVMRVYLPTCTPEEAAHIFGPADSMFMEGESPATLLRMESGPKGVLAAHVPLGG